jgi:hypothetical protein
VTDNYFIDVSAGAGQMVTIGGASELNTAGALITAGNPEVGPSTAGGSGSSRGGTGAGGMSASAGSMSTNAGSLSTDGGSNDAGSSDAGSPSGGLGGSSGSGSAGNGGRETSAGGPSGGAGTAGSSSHVPDPVCKDGVTKGTACNAASIQLCYKDCGPDNVGYKPLSCQGLAYDETQPGCTFPPGDYSCYRLPPSLPTACPAGTPRGGQACQIPTCTVCYGGTLLNPQYQDSTGAQKTGYCVCSSAGIWTCGSNSGSWPCPGMGCN